MMKSKLFTVLVLVVTLTSCEGDKIQKAAWQMNGEFSTVVIDGCEYYVNRIYGITHKGNCKNEFHKK